MSPHCELRRVAWELRVAAELGQRPETLLATARGDVSLVFVVLLFVVVPMVVILVIAN